MIYFFSCYVCHRDLHVLSHAFPTRRSSDLLDCAVAAEDALDSRATADLAAGLAERPRHRLGAAAHAATREAPGANVAVDLAHVVMQQHIGGARRVDPEPGPDDAGAGEMGLHHLGLEVLVEEFADRHGPEADRLGHLAL